MYRIDIPYSRVEGRNIVLSHSYFLANFCCILRWEAKFDMETKISSCLLKNITHLSNGGHIISLTNVLLMCSVHLKSMALEPWCNLSYGCVMGILGATGRSVHVYSTINTECSLPTEALMSLLFVLDSIRNGFFR